MRKYELILKSNMVSHDRMDNRPIAKQMVTFLVPWHKESCEVLSQRVMWGIIVTLCLLPSSSSSENILYFRMKSKNDTSYLSFWLFEMRIWQNINIAQFLLVTSCKVKFIFSIHIVSWS